MNDVKITIWEAELISDLQQDSDSQRAEVQQHIYSGELSRSHGGAGPRREPSCDWNTAEGKTAKHRIQQESEKNTTLTSTAEAVLLWELNHRLKTWEWSRAVLSVLPEQDQWVGRTSGRCTAGPEQSAGGIIGQQDGLSHRTSVGSEQLTLYFSTQVDDLCSPSLLRLTPARLTTATLTSSKFILVAERVGATSGTLCSTFYRYHVRFIVSDWLEITFSVDLNPVVGLMRINKSSLLIFSCKMLHQILRKAETHSDRTISLK